jgi:hypothetical protein
MLPTRPPYPAGSRRKITDIGANRHFHAIFAACGAACKRRLAHGHRLGRHAEIASSSVSWTEKVAGSAPYVVTITNGRYLRH